MNINTSTSKDDEPSQSNNEGISSPTDIKPTLSTQLNNATTPTSKRYVQMINDASGPLDDILDSIMITPKNNSNIVGMQQDVGVGEEKVHNGVGDDIIEGIVNVDSEELDDDNWPMQTQRANDTNSNEVVNTSPTKLNNTISTTTNIATPKSSNKKQPASTISTINITTSNTATVISDNNMTDNRMSNNSTMNSPTETEFSQVFKGTSLIDATSKVVIQRLSIDTTTLNVEKTEEQDNSISTTTNKSMNKMNEIVDISNAGDKKRERRRLRRSKSPPTQRRVVSSTSDGEELDNMPDTPMSKAKVVLEMNKPTEKQKRAEIRKKLREKSKPTNWSSSDGKDKEEDGVDDEEGNTEGISNGEEMKPRSPLSITPQQQLKRLREKTSNNIPNRSLATTAWDVKGEVGDGEEGIQRFELSGSPSIIRETIMNRAAQARARAIPSKSALQQSSRSLSNRSRNNATVDKEGNSTEEEATLTPPPKSSTKRNVDMVGSPPKTPVTSNKKVPAAATVDNTTTQLTPTSSQKLILTPKEVEMKLIDGAESSADAVSLPILETTTATTTTTSAVDNDKNEARRNRRHLRKSSVVKGTVEDKTIEVEPKEDGDKTGVEQKGELEEEDQQVSATDNESIDNIDKRQQQNIETKQESIRSSSPTSSFVTDASSSKNVNPQVSAVIAKALDKARKQKLEKDKSISILDDDDDRECVVVTDEEEVKKLFPQDDSLNNTPPSTSADTADTSLKCGTAWSTTNISQRNNILEQTKIYNKTSSKNDNKALFDLDIITSDNINGKNEEEGVKSCSVSKLLLQQERMNMYNSGKFGVGDDSSVDDDADDEEVSVKDSDSADNNVEVTDNNEALFDYEDMNNMIDDVDDNEDDTEVINEDKEALDMFHLVQDNVPTFTPGEENEISEGGRVNRWDSNPDCISEVSSKVTNASSSVGLNFVGSSTVCSSTHGAKSPQFELDPDATPKIGSITKGSSGRKIIQEELDGNSRKNSSAKLFKIPPPPPEKLREWEESKGGLARRDRSSSINSAKSDDKSPRQSNNAGGALNYKLHTPKSPKKKPHSLEEELDLVNHKRFAEKIVMATSKAARKFEEEYDENAPSPKQQDQVSPSSSTDRFFSCAGETSQPRTNSSPEQLNLQMPAVGELTRGAFSPWKIPDRADDNESSIASSARMLYENETYVKAAMAAATSISDAQYNDNDERGKVSEQQNKDDTHDESFEISLEEEGGGALTSVLTWLFNEVLPPDSSIVAAFSAFDIDTATAVQYGRCLAIANDDESFNIICRYVATSVMKQYGNARVEVKRETNDGVPCQIGDGNNNTAGSDISVSTFETTSSVSDNKPAFAERAAARILKRIVDPFQIPASTDDTSTSRGPNPDELAAGLASFLQQISNLTGLQSPFDNDNPFIPSAEQHNLNTSRRGEGKTMQDLVFSDQDRLIAIFQFLEKACKGDEVKRVLSDIEEGTADGHHINNDTSYASPKGQTALSCISSDYHAKTKATVRKSNRSSRPRKSSTRQTVKPRSHSINLNYLVPNERPSPFEKAVWNTPSIVPLILSFLGNPVSVCVMKRLNVFCNRIVCENQHVLMRDAVRLGGMSKYVRPSFWLWVTEMNKTEPPIQLRSSRRGYDPRNAPTSTSGYKGDDFLKLKESGENGKWKNIIERDVTRAFGNMPPHKTGARYRQDSIVRALVSFGREEIMRNSRSYQALSIPEESEAKHFKLSSRLDKKRDDSSNGSSGSLTPTDTVSDWGGISPVGSLVTEDETNPVITEESMKVVSFENGEVLETSTKQHPKLNVVTSRSDVSDPVLSGNALTNEMKVDLQDKLRSILHALAARHEGVGYCQGMDYVVAHLLRVLQDTILLRVVQRSMPGGQTEVDDWRTISSDELRTRMNDINTNSIVVEDVVFRVMDTFFSTYSLQHMYWPELRCLKTFCRVFESLIKQKLPVLADHFQHHDLNVGLFALGWFQTLFLYLPSMPSATVCHIWDIWLVERSFKIFFRIGTAILFLSQPTLLNHDLEGMMTYLNTFPDATLLRRDILIPCALQIKITNRMLVEIEMEVAKTSQAESGNEYFSD